METPRVKRADSPLLSLSWLFPVESSLPSPTAPLTEELLGRVEMKSYPPLKANPALKVGLAAGHMWFRAPVSQSTELSLLVPVTVRSVAVTHEETSGFVRSVGSGLPRTSRDLPMRGTPPIKP